MKRKKNTAYQSSNLHPSNCHKKDVQGRYLVRFQRATKGILGIPHKPVIEIQECCKH